MQQKCVGKNVNYDLTSLLLALTKSTKIISEHATIMTSIQVINWSITSTHRYHYFSSRISVQCHYLFFKYTYQINIDQMRQRQTNSSVPLSVYHRLKYHLQDTNSDFIQRSLELLTHVASRDVKSRMT